MAAIFATLVVLPEITESFTLVGKPRTRDSVLSSKISGDVREEQHNGSGAESELPGGSDTSTTNRRRAVARLLASPVMIASAVSVATATPSFAADSTPVANNNNKQTKLSQADFVKIAVDTDLVQNQFLVNGKLTRSIYDESSTFKDEIDTYGLQQWMSGTAKLFDEDRSRVVLVPGSVQPTDEAGSISLRFVEYLCFNIPFVKPIVYLSGTLLLSRSETSGLITSYKEEWDQDIYKVLTSKSKLFTSGLSKESLDRDLDVFSEANAQKPAAAN